MNAVYPVIAALEKIGLLPIGGKISSDAAPRREYQCRLESGK